MTATRIRLAGAVGACALGAAVLSGSSPAPAAAAGPRPVIDWQACPAYGDDVLKALGIADADLAKAHALLARMRCGTVEVPLDYGKPDGTKIKIALTRLPAADQAHRLGSMALNPGGPGGSGYLMGFQLAMGSTSAGLNERYDLIGFDPRGVGYSTKVNCPPPQVPPGGEEPAPGPVTEAAAKERYDVTVSNNAACAAYDPTFLAQLTTTNVARDIDQIRRGLGERRISYFGVSWGTWLGVVYRNLFPRQTARMWLDSSAPPKPANDAYQAAKAKANERDFGRMAAWMAQRNGTYGFGTTADQVSAAMAKLRKDFDANFRKFTDLPDRTFDGGIIAGLSSQNSSQWPVLAEVLKELRDATSGTAAPPEVKKVFGPPTEPPPQGPPPANLPERQNQTAALALNCNDDTGDRTFEAAWAAYQRELASYPVTGESNLPAAQCAGWPLPVEKVTLRHGNGSLQLSGHQWETISAYEFTLQVKAAVGGRILTVDDDIHGSAIREPSCAPKVVAYFNTGKPQTGHCAGAAVPTG